MKKKLLAVLFAAVLAFALCTCGKTEMPDLAGDYQDEISQRATLTLEKTDEENYSIGINWSVSSFEGVYWTMTGQFDGETLSYSDGECHYYKMDENGETETDEVTESGLSGSFKLTDEGKLEWTGATEDETGVFVKIEG